MQENNIGIDGMAVGTLFAYSVYLTGSRIACSAKTINRYPDHLSETVEKVRSLITPEIHEELTTKRGGMTAKVKLFPEVPEWIVKGSSWRDVIDDIRSFLSEGILRSPDGAYWADNDEGYVYRNNLTLAARVHNAKTMRKIIKQHQLSMVHVPKKYLCSYSQQVGWKSIFNKGCFVLAEYCKGAEKSPRITFDGLQELTSAEKEQLAKELIVFLRHSGIVDIHPLNCYVKNKQFVLFDTEPMSLTLGSSLLCGSISLREARVNYRNAIKNFQMYSNTENISEAFEHEISKLRARETFLLIRQIICVALVILFSFTPCMDLSTNTQ